MLPYFIISRRITSSRWFTADNSPCLWESPYSIFAYYINHPLLPRSRTFSCLDNFLCACNLDTFQPARSYRCLSKRWRSYRLLLWLYMPFGFTIYLTNPRHFFIPFPRGFHFTRYIHCRRFCNNCCTYFILLFFPLFFSLVSDSFVLARR